MLELANVKPLILVGLATVNEHRIIVFLILKRASISRRIAEQGKRARPHPEASPHADVGRALDSTIGFRS